MTKSGPKKEGKIEPMDPSIREQVVGTPATNQQRVCYAIKTLVAEVTELFPETRADYSEFDGRNTALGVTFDISMMDNDDAISFAQLLGLTKSDVRVEEVISEDAQVFVAMKSSSRTQDDRSTFGLGDAWMVMTDGVGSGAEGYMWVGSW